MDWIKQEKEAIKILNENNIGHCWVCENEDRTGFVVEIYGTLAKCIGVNGVRAIFEGEGYKTEIRNKKTFINNI